MGMIGESIFETKSIMAMQIPGPFVRKHYLAGGYRLHIYVIYTSIGEPLTSTMFPSSDGLYALWLFGTKLKWSFGNPREFVSLVVANTKISLSFAKARNNQELKSTKQNKVSVS